MYSANNPVNAVDLDGKQAHPFSRLGGLTGINQAKVENDINQSIENVNQAVNDGAKATINATIATSDLASDVSTGYILGGGACIAAGGLLSSTGFGASLGIPLSTAGFNMLATGVAVNTVSNYVSLAAKTVNLNYGGSGEEVHKQLNQTLRDFTMNKFTYGVLNSKFMINSASSPALNDATSNLTTSTTSLMLNYNANRSTSIDYYRNNSNSTNAPVSTYVKRDYQLNK